jgi:hypothetical protein
VSWTEREMGDKQRMLLTLIFDLSMYMYSVHYMIIMIASYSDVRAHIPIGIFGNIHMSVGD